jgi:hypothetical protein
MLIYEFQGVVCVDGLVHEVAKPILGIGEPDDAMFSPSQSILTEIRDQTREL